MKKRILTIAAIAAFLTATGAAIYMPATASQTETPSPQATLDIPRLLPRQASLGDPSERAQIAELYDRTTAALKKDPNDAKSLLKLAEIYMNEARITGEHPYYYPAALSMLDRVLTAGFVGNDLLYQAMYMKASVQLSLHHFDKALATGQSAIRINAYDAGIYGVLVDAHVELGQYSQAVEMSDKMISIRPDLRSYSRVSYLREIHGEVEGAIEAMKLAVDASFPGYEQTAWCRTTLAALYERYGDLDNAAMHYQITLQDRPDYPFAIAGLASIEAKRGNHETAIQYLDKAASIIPEVGFYTQKAEVLMDLGKQDEARALAAKALEMMQEDTDKGHNMDLEYAHVYLDLLGDTRKALDYALREYSLRPANLDVNKVLAATYLTMGDLPKASEHITLARATKTHDPETLALAGLIAVKQGNPTQGKPLIREAFERNPHLSGDLYTQALQQL